MTSQRPFRQPGIAMPWGVALMAGLLGLSGLGTISQLLSEHAAQDPALASPPPDVEPHTLPELIVDLDDRLNEAQVALSYLAAMARSIRRLQAMPLRPRVSRARRWRRRARAPGTAADRAASRHAGRSGRLCPALSHSRDGTRRANHRRR